MKHLHKNGPFDAIALSFIYFTTKNVDNFSQIYLLEIWNKTFIVCDQLGIENHMRSLQRFNRKLQF